MIRIVEILMFLAPFAIFVVWRMFFPDTLLSPKVMAFGAVILVILFATLVYFRQEDAEPAGATYVPAELHGDRITPPRAAP